MKLLVLLWVVFLASSAIPSVTVFTNTDPTHFASVAEAHVPTLEERSNMIANEYSIATSTLWNLVTEESSGGQFREGDGGDSCGVIHINKNYYPEEFKRCGDDDFVLRFAAQLIQDGKEYVFTSCSCVQYVRIFTKLPKGNASDLKPNSPPRVGAVAIYKYGEVSHVGYIQEIKDGGWIERGSNIKPCQSYTRFVKADPNLVGFYLPEAISQLRD